MSDALQNFADSLIAMNAGQSGQMGAQAQFLNSIQARGMRAKEEAKLKKREADIEAFLLKNPQYRQQYELSNLLGIQSQQKDYPTSYEEYLLGEDDPNFAAFLDRNKTKPKRESYVAKDGYRYYVDGKQERVHPFVKEEQTQEDIFKENTARIKNIVVNEGENSPKLTEFERNFYNTYIKPRSGSIIDQMIAAQFGFENNETSTPPPTSYKIINDAYKNESIDSIINQAMSLNNDASREQVIKELIAAGIIASK